MQNYLYRYRRSLIASNYPEVQQYLTEICAKTWNSSLKEDELFFLHSDFQNDEVSLLFSSKALLLNCPKQYNLQPMFIHLDSTFKLVDLGLPLMIVSTKTLNHNFRHLAFFLTWSESLEAVKLLFKKLCSFYADNLQIQFRPLFIMTDNVDVLITGCQKSFDHQYIHLGCQFHLPKE